MTNLILKELMEHYKSLRFVAGWLALLLLVLASVFLLSGEYSNKLENEKLALQVKERGISDYAHYNRMNWFVYPVRPLEKTEVLFRGLGNPGEEDEFFVDVLNRLIPSFDIVFILTTLVSLLSIIFTFDSVCGERETGTLKLLHTSPVARWKVLAAKWSGAFLSTAVPLLVAFLLAALASSMISGVALSGDFLLTILFTWIGALLYAGFFLALGILVSTSVRHSSTSILVLLFLWVIFVLAIPNASPIIASQVEPLPSVASIEREMSRIQNRVRDERIVEEMVEVIASFVDEKGLSEPEGGSTWEKGGKLADVDYYLSLGIAEEQAKALQVDFSNRFNAVVQRVNEEQGEKADQIRAELDRKVEKQRQLAMALSLLSPTSTMTYFATDIASLGLSAEAYIDDERRQYMESFRDWARQRIESIEEESGVKIGANDKVDFSGWPRYQHRQQPFMERLFDTSLNLVHLLIFLLLAFLLSVFAYQRYDIR